MGLDFSGYKYPVMIRYVTYLPTVLSLHVKVDPDGLRGLAKLCSHHARRMKLWHPARFVEAFCTVLKDKAQGRLSCQKEKPR